MQMKNRMETNQGINAREMMNGKCFWRFSTSLSSAVINTQPSRSVMTHFTATEESTTYFMRREVHPAVRGWPGRQCRECRATGKSLGGFLGLAPGRVSRFRVKGLAAGKVVKD